MKKFVYSELSESEIKELTKRPSIKIDQTLEIVKPILQKVKQEGYKAVVGYAQEFDKFLSQELQVTEQEFIDSEKMISEELKSAIKSAYKNIYEFHKYQIPKPYEVETQKGIICRREFRAIENVGLYIPGGTAILPSTMLMLGIPAQLADCKRVVAISPTNEKIHPAILYAANLCGISEFYKVGGAHGIAMMAYGTENISKVDKIFGPGNQYVTAAKMLVSMDSEGCAIDMPAGPSEVLIIADGSANPNFIAADLLSQAEHGNDSQVVLLTTSELLLEKVQRSVQEQLTKLERKNYAEQALLNSFSIVFDDIESAILFSNLYAPEHLILNCNEAESLTKKIVNAGSVFIGEYSPESVGDYASGTNHSLPTYGYAKSHSGLSVEAFIKSITFQKLSYEGLKEISNTVIKLAETEKLDAHANAVKIRIM